MRTRTFRGGYCALLGRGTLLLSKPTAYEIRRFSECPRRYDMVADAASVNGVLPGTVEMFRTFVAIFVVTLGQ